MDALICWINAVGEWLESHDGAITAVSTAFIAIFTIALAIYTKRLGRMAVKQDARMRESIRVSKNAMKLSEAAMVAGERAFVFPIGLHQFWERNQQTGLYSWRFRPNWHNSGDTPTKNFVFHSECVVRDSVLPAGFDFAYETTNTGKGLLPPKMGLLGGLAPRAPTPAITTQDILGVYAGTKFIYFWGWARYWDIFPNTPEHITRFCWAITVVGDPTTFIPESTDPQHRLTFGYLYHPEGNCADEECG